MPNSEDQMDQSVSPINQEIIDDLYDKYCADPLSVPEDWREYFSALEARNEQIKEAEPHEKEPHKVKGTESAISARDVTRSDLPPAPPVAASEPTSPYVARETALDLGPGGSGGEEDKVERLRGVAKAVVKNMDESLQIPTATSAREIPAKLLIENRKVINTHLAATTGGKVSFTHLIGYAIIEALVEMPSMNVRFEKDEDGHDCIRKFAHVGFGLAIDLPKDDGSRSLMVPVVHDADTLNFRQFIDAYEDLVKRARSGALKPADFAGGTVTLTNPGTLGTKHSVPRLMAGQGAIIGVGATSFPAEWAGASPSQLANAGVGQVMTMTSTYDHRVIQGAGSGEFLRIIEQKLTGHDGFFERVFSTLGVAHEPYQWERDFSYDAVTEKGKPARIAELIHAYRSRGHLAANTDPLQQILRRHPDLSIGSYGLSVWDLDRVFPTGGFAGRDTMNLRDLLEQLRSTYTQAIGIEYMHIQDPVQRRWVQSRIEKPSKKLSKDEQMHVLSMLNHAEAFETFLQTKYVGQKRFSLEGAESLIPLLDKMLSSASRTGLKEITIGMAHRGRLNVLSNVAGKSYGQIFSEFEGYLDPNSTQGSGAVKYHIGTEGIYSSAEGDSVLVSLTANPSHLEAANGVTEGITRAKQDRLGGGKEAESQVMPILIHGDAAFIGEGVVQETLNMSQLRGYRTGGTVHIIVNNQIGFTTGPTSGRSTRYCTDLAKGLQVPIFHVNGDFPQDVVKAAKLAFDFRQEFHKDVIIDMVCYRRRGHNEGDDPSMTQPVLYSLIDSLPTTREVYTRNLIGRGELSEEKAQEALQEYHDDLNKIFQETREKKEFDAEGHDDTTN
ncbi:multifunctional oxoglutarate decarboxylase/oxoglutarate dehydrogenase thiamine pyrophosphate-binding subunit/dihydrolipoyllysine-residue succinyltransferase subunit, partial [uncultured Varibaculum sp.]|uniref:multifunctional oxoglutarate decarboxylase/oxoglutarate dehydrogenase thiamine pyrophosphate-binding subunit/dihydrolipoyllysine-residue succinyltransferase subunit n=1 Tax=uncultured Varibaculum sp. TaxID=413896 RepID=UPI00288AFBA0